jgi:hypothetical protein
VAGGQPEIVRVLLPVVSGSSTVSQFREYLNSRQTRRMIPAGFNS